MVKKSFIQRFWPIAIILALLIVLLSVGYAKGWIGYHTNYDQPLSKEQLSEETTTPTEAEKQSVVSPDVVTEKVAEAVEETPAPKPQAVASAPVPQPSAPKPAPKPATTKKPVPSAPSPSATSQTAPAPVSASSEIVAILNAINTVRQQNGLTTVRLNSQLNSAALAKSQDMYNNNYFAHTSPSGVSDFDFVVNSSYKYQQAGVNLAKGNFGGAQGLVDAWMGSPGHKANILANFGHELGIGIIGQYFTMIIASPR